MASRCLSSRHSSDASMAAKTESRSVRDWNLAARTDSTLYSESYTNNRYAKFVHHWKIDNFSLFEQNPKALESLTFPAHSNGIKWKLKFRKNSSSDDDETWFSLFLVYCGSKEVEAFESFFILNQNGEKVNKKNINKQHKLKCSDGYGISKFVSKEKLLKWKDALLPDDKLTVGCEVYVCLGPATGKHEAQFVRSKNKKFTWSFDIQEALKNHEQTDVLIVVGEEKIQAHTFVLACRSKVFAAMFQHDMLEKKLQCVVIDDVTPEVMHQFLLFLYTDKVERLREFAYDLFKLADKYDVENLKIMAEEELANGLTTGNAVRVLKVADLHNSDRLQYLAVEFIVKHFHDVPKGKEWQNLKHYHANMFEKIMFSAFEK